MDTTTVLDKYTQDLSNLPLEIKHLFEEIKNKDQLLQETRKKYQTKDSQLHKFIRANGTLTKHPKEPQLVSKINEEMDAVEKIQKEKILLSNTALFLISKHLYSFETDIAKLENEELLPRVENIFEGEEANSDSNSAFAGLSDSLSGTPTPRNNFSSAITENGSGVFRKGQKRKYNLTHKHIGMRPMRRPRSEDPDDDDDVGYVAKGSTHEGPPSGANGEDADNNLYCFCQRVSFGEMIGCDNDDCKYEWFHWSCVGITSPPKDDDIWYCPDCAPKMEKRKKKRK